MGEVRNGDQKVWKYFKAVRPFFTRIFFKNYLGWRGQKNSLKISSGAQSEDLEPSLTIQEFFSKKYFWFYMQRMCTLFGQLACDHGRYSRQLDQYGC